jgi:hypothetical protein
MTLSYMNPRLTARAFLVTLALTVVPALGAQSVGMVGAAKEKANNAVAATNAHTQAMTADQSQAPAKPQPAPASAPTAKAVAITASKTTTAPLPAAKAVPVAPVKGAPVKAVAVAPVGKGKAAPVAAVAVPDADSGARSISVTQRGVKGEVSLNREVFSYDPAGRRDPFLSLLRTGDLRPMLSDLRLVTVLYDPTGRNSIAVMRDVATKDQYRVKVGQTLGRMRVAQIQPRQIVFTIEEVGFSRQEPLALGDSSTARTQ